jgi:hypothetical protein
VKTITLTGATKAVDVSGITVDATGITATAGAGGAKITGGAGVDTITGGVGVDTIVGNGGADVIVGGGGKDVITGGVGADAVTISGGANKLVYAVGDSGANITTNTQVSELTTGFDVVKGAVAGDTIQLNVTMGSNVNGYQFGDVTVGAANLAGVIDQIVFSYGTYDAAAGIFSYAANGLDSVMTYGSNDGGTAFESIILVGYHAGANTSAANGLITLA